MNLKALQEAWSLYQTDSTAETVIAVALALLMLSPFLLRLWEEQKESSGGNALGNGV